MTSSLFAQVGIGTVSPEATLDINGTVKIRTIPQTASPTVMHDSIVVTNQGFVEKMPAKVIIEKALPTALKGSCSSVGLVNLSLLSGTERIPFDSMAFDMNNEYDTVTHTYTSKQSGIFEVYLQIKLDPTVSAATNIGAMIVKNGVVENKSSYANVNVIGINVTPPIRQVRSLVQLAVGDTIELYIEGDIALGSVDILGSAQDSYFSIYQVR